MKITEGLLDDLGFVLSDTGKWKNAYTLIMHGYSFKLKHFKEGTWQFILDDDSMHMVTDLEECFGFIAKDYYLFGKQGAKEELRAWLND